MLSYSTPLARWSYDIIIVFYFKENTSHAVLDFHELGFLLLQEQPGKLDTAPDCVCIATMTIPSQGNALGIIHIWEV